MADPTDADKALKQFVDNAVRELQRFASAGRFFGVTFRDAQKSLEGVSEKIEDAVSVSVRLAQATWDKAKAEEELKKKLIDAKVSSTEFSSALGLFKRGIGEISKEIDISTMSMTEMIARYRDGTLSMKELGKAVVGQFANMKYGLYGVALDLAKGLEQVDIQTRKATIGLMGIGGGMMGGAGGIPVPGGALRAYQPDMEMQAAAGKAIGSLILMGKTSEQASGEIRSMTQVFGANFMGMGARVSMEAAKVASAFALAAGVSEEVARSATVNLIMRFGMSAERAASTLVRFDKEARSVGMSTNNYTSWVTELSQATRTYTSDIGFSQAVVQRFGKALQEGQITIQQFAQMATALRQSDFGRQAGIMALAQQVGVRVPGLAPGASPLAAIGFVGQRGQETTLLAVQVQTMKALANQMAGPGANQQDRMGAMRIAAQEFPALRGLQSLSNDTMKDILSGIMDLGEIQKVIDKTDPTKQMENLIGTAEKIGVAVTPLAEAIMKTIQSGAFKVIPMTAEAAASDAKERKMLERSQERTGYERQLNQRVGQGDAQSKTERRVYAEMIRNKSINIGEPQTPDALELARTSKMAGFQSGTEFVPKTGMAMLHRGEAVIPAPQAASMRGGAQGGGSLNLSVQVGLVGSDIEGVVRRVADEVRKALHRSDVTSRRS